MSVPVRRNRSSFLKREKLLPQINIVPYVDVLLVLLVIMMATTPLMLQGVEVSLPQENTQAVTPKDSQMIVNVTAKDHYILDQQKNGKSNPQTFDQLSELTTYLVKHQDTLRNIPVYLAVESSVSYSHLSHVIAALGDAGMSHVGLLTEPKQS